MVRQETFYFSAYILSFFYVTHKIAWFSPISECSLQNWFEVASALKRMYRKFWRKPCHSKMCCWEKITLSIPILACSYGLCILCLVVRWVGGPFEMFHSATGPENKNKVLPEAIANIWRGKHIVMEPQTRCCCRFPEDKLSVFNRISKL